MRQPAEYHDRGQAALGEEITLRCQCRNANYSPTAPDAAPTMVVYNAAGTAVLSIQIPVQDKYGRNGLFAHNLLLDSSFAAGRYWATYDWTTGGGGYAGAALDTFEVLPGGDEDGEIISLIQFQRPHGTHLIGQTNAGKLILARNPHV